MRERERDESCCFVFRSRSASFVFVPSSFLTFRVLRSKRERESFGREGGHTTTHHHHHITTIKQQQSRERERERTGESRLKKNRVGLCKNARQKREFFSSIFFVFFLSLSRLRVFGFRSPNFSLLVLFLPTMVVASLAAAFLARSASRTRESNVLLRGLSTVPVSFFLGEIVH